jgi:hypothetical protein
MSELKRYSYSSRDNRQARGWASVLVVCLISKLVTSCYSPSLNKDLDTSETLGFWRSQPAPLSASELRKAFRAFSASLACSPKPISSGSLQGELLKSIAVTGGMPRWQARQLLLGLMDPDQAVCGGSTCKQDIPLKRGGIDDFLDTAFQYVKNTDTKNLGTLSNKRNVLEESLRPDFVRPKIGLAHQKVELKSEAIANGLALQRIGVSSLTYGQLGNINSLVIRAHQTSQQLDLSDIPLFPNLKRVTLAVWNPKDLVLILPYVHLFDELEFSRPPSTTAPKLSTGALASFATMSHLKRIHLTGLAIDDPMDLPRIFSYAKMMSIANIERYPDQISDEVLMALSKMPYLRTLELHVAGIDQVRKWKAPLGASIRDIRINLASSGDCGGLEPFLSFRSASALTVRHCQLSSLGPFNSAVAWRHLKLENPSRAGGSRENLELKISPELDRLITFESNISWIQLDARSRQELAIRIAKGWDRSEEEWRKETISAE